MGFSLLFPNRLTRRNTVCSAFCINIRRTRQIYAHDVQIRFRSNSFLELKTARCRAAEAWGILKRPKLHRSTPLPLLKIVMEASNDIAAADRESQSLLVRLLRPANGICCQRRFMPDRCPSAAAICLGRGRHSGDNGSEFCGAKLRV